MPTKSESIRTKGVHVKLDKSTHAAFKAKLVEYGLSMQEAFEEFARLVGSGNFSANNILERLIRRQIKAELATVGLKPMKQRLRHVSELDANRLYDLINEGEEENDVHSNGGCNEVF
jgi:hypothetical protein